MPFIKEIWEKLRFLTLLPLFFQKFWKSKKTTCPRVWKFFFERPHWNKLLVYAIMWSYSTHFWLLKQVLLIFLSKLAHIKVSRQNMQASFIKFSLKMFHSSRNSLQFSSLFVISKPTWHTNHIPFKISLIIISYMYSITIFFPYTRKKYIKKIIKKISLTNRKKKKDIKYYVIWKKSFPSQKIREKNYILKKSSKAILFSCLWRCFICAWLNVW